MELSVIVPCYNEQGTLEEFYQNIKDVFTKEKITYELIFVDDGSEDDTFSILEKISLKDKDVKVISFSRNFGKESAMQAGLLNASLKYADSELSNWYELVSKETKIRVALVHNNLELNHLLNNKLISWDKYTIDTPILDIVNLYKKEWQNMNFSECLSRYIYKFPLLEYEKKLLFILLSLPPSLEKFDSEFKKCQNISNLINYIFKTEELIRPYNTEHEEEK